MENVHKFQFPDVMEFEEREGRIVERSIRGRGRGNGGFVAMTCARKNWLTGIERR